MNQTDERNTSTIEHLPPNVLPDPITEQIVSSCEPDLISCVSGQSSSSTDAVLLVPPEALDNPVGAVTSAIPDVLESTFEHHEQHTVNNVSVVVDEKIVVSEKFDYNKVDTTESIDNVLKREQNIPITVEPPEVRSAEHQPSTSATPERRYDVAADLVRCILSL